MLRQRRSKAKKASTAHGTVPQQNCQEVAFSAAGACLSFFFPGNISFLAAAPSLLVGGGRVWEPNVSEASRLDMESDGLGGQESLVGVTWSPGLETNFFPGSSGSSRLLTFLWNWRGPHVKLKSFPLGPSSMLSARWCMRLLSSSKAEPGKGQAVLSMAGCHGGLCWPTEGASLLSAGSCLRQQSLAPTWCWKAPLTPYHLSIIYVGLAHWRLLQAVSQLCFMPAGFPMDFLLWDGCTLPSALKNDTVLSDSSCLWGLMSPVTQYSSLSHFAFACLGVWLLWQPQAIAVLDC